jgi:hypothetical protein
MLTLMVLWMMADDARTVVQQAIDAMGGEARLRQIRVVKVEAIGHRYLLDQSERPEGPWIAIYEQRIELRDLERQRVRRTTDTREIQTPTWRSATAVVADEMLALEPERLLLTAREAADLRLLPDDRLQDVAQRRLQFTFRGQSIVLRLNAHTMLPTAIDVTTDNGTDTWGEVTRRVLFSYWNLESNGLLYPRQQNVLWNGYPQSELSIVALTINPAIEDNTFEVSSTPQRPSFRALPLATDVDTLADGVVQIRGLWNVAFVKQSDGVVIVEAPISSEYSEQVLDEAAKRFPGAAIKAVITTSDAWPHMAGVRAYAARGIPIYALDVNKPILDRLLAARYPAKPDRLAREPRAADFRLVSGRTVIGDGPNQLVLHPIRGENGERMMLVHFPARRLLYTSDEVMHASRTSSDFFMPAYLVDVEAAMHRAGIASVDTIFGMHLRATPWGTIESVLTAARPRP